MKNLGESLFIFALQFLGTHRRFGCERKRGPRESRKNRSGKGGVRQSSQGAGSRVRGEEKKTSDIDMLVSFDRRVDLFDLMELEEFLQDIFQYKIDLALKRSLKPLIGKHILAEVEYL